MGRVGEWCKKAWDAALRMLFIFSLAGLIAILVAIVAIGNVDTEDGVDTEYHSVTAYANPTLAESLNRIFQGEDIEIVFIEPIESEGFYQAYEVTYRYR